MDASTIAQGVAALVGGSGLWKVWTDQKHDRERCEKERRETHDRLRTLEIKHDTGFPEWRKSFDGTYRYVNAEYVRIMLMPFGKSSVDIVGKKDADIAEFDPALRGILKALDEKACEKGYATAHHVQFHPKTRPMTIIKRSVADPLTTELSLMGIACPEFD